MLINHYSYIVVGLFILLLITALSGRLIGIRYGVYAGGLTLILLTIFQMILSTSPDHSSNDYSFDDPIASGTPVVLMLYSNL